MPMSLRRCSLLAALAIALAIAPSPAFADDVAVQANLATERAWNVGARVGANFADMGGDLAIEAAGQTIDSTPRVQERLSGGLTFAYAFSDTLSGRAEAVYSRLGAQASQVLGANGERIAFHYDLGYVRVPILATYSFPYDGAFSQFVFAGPEVGFLVSSAITTEGLLPNPMGGVVEVDESTDAKDITATFDAGVTLGAGVTLPVSGGDLVIDLRYTFGFTRVTSNGTIDIDAGGGQMVGVVTEDLRNRGLSLNVGYQY